MEHRELLDAAKDPVLLEAGAQPRIFEALSSRLGAYEKAGKVAAAERNGKAALENAGKAAVAAVDEVPVQLEKGADRQGDSQVRSGFGRLVNVVLACLQSRQKMYL